LGAAEAGFFPGVIVYLSHWFIHDDGAKATSNFMAAIPTRAIYEYLKAVPCIQGNYPGPGGPEANIPLEPADRCSD
jgi:hypothetical protein